MYDFGLLLKHLREQAGLTQGQLAEKIYRSKTAVCKYESNLQMPTLDTMIQLSLVFNVSLDYLAGIDKKNALSLQGLSEEQECILTQLASAFRSMPKKAGAPTKGQLELIGRIITEFSREKE